jgi:predicted small secreted protein
MKKLVRVALLGAPLVLAACNTVEGVGKDVSSAGSAVAREADKNK